MIYVFKENCLYKKIGSLKIVLFLVEILLFRFLLASNRI